MPARLHAYPLHRCPAAARQHPFHAGLEAIRNDETVARNDPHQMMKLRLDGGQVGKDIGVVELEIVENRRARVVVDELGALVEEGGVVLVGLDHEESRCREPRRYAEVLGYAADEKSRLETAVLQQPGEHGGGGGLAVRAGHGQHPLVPQHVLVQPLRAGDIGQVAIEDRLHQRVAARDDVADDEQIGLEITCWGAQPSMSSMPCASSCVLMGG